MFDPVIDFFKSIFYWIGRAIGQFVAWVLWPFRAFSRWLKGSVWFIKIPVFIILILLAMLAAPGTSVLRNVYVINRGYEELAERLNALGATIETFRDI